MEEKLYSCLVNTKDEELINGDIMYIEILVERMSPDCYNMWLVLKRMSCCELQTETRHETNLFDLEFGD